MVLFSGGSPLARLPITAEEAATLAAHVGDLESHFWNLNQESVSSAPRCFWGLSLVICSSVFNPARVDCVFSNKNFDQCKKGLLL